VVTVARSQIAAAIVTQAATVPIAATFPNEQISEARRSCSPRKAAQPPRNVHADAQDACGSLGDARRDSARQAAAILSAPDVGRARHH